MMNEKLVEIKSNYLQKGIPFLEITEPIDDREKKIIWQKFVKKNFFSRNSLDIIAREVITYNDTVGYKYLCKPVSFPVIAPIWLRVTCHFPASKREATGKDGHEYFIYERKG